MKHDSSDIIGFISDQDASERMKYIEHGRTLGIYIVVFNIVIEENRRAHRMGIGHVTTDDIIAYTKLDKSTIEDIKDVCYHLSDHCIDSNTFCRLRNADGKIENKEEYNKLYKTIKLQHWKEIMTKEQYKYLHEAIQYVFKTEYQDEIQSMVSED